MFAVTGTEAVSLVIYGILWVAAVILMGLHSSREKTIRARALYLVTIFVPFVGILVGLFIGIPSALRHRRAAA